VSNRKRLTVRHEVAGGTRVHLDALINEQGDLVLEGQDIGAAPGQIFGASEYEYWLTVAADHKDRLLLELVAAVFRTTSMTTSDFQEWLKVRGIPGSFFSQ
jgi:hypothetical protein